MLKLKKVSRMTTITLLILLVSLPIATFQVPNVSAWDNEYVHPHLCRESLRLLPGGSAMRIEIANYMGNIEWGATDEDENDVIFHYSIDPTITHFWDADEGPYHPHTFAFKDHPNAYRKSWWLFDKALYAYKHDGDMSRAYRLLGRVAHLMQDMAVPAHAHEDPHPGFWAGEWAPGTIGGGDDCLENWFEQYDVYSQWTADALLTLGVGLIEFPEDVEWQMRNRGNWTVGLYYLMYTTNQVADYFASDNEHGDEDDPEGWMGYSDFPDRPTRDWELDDNDRKQIGPGYVDDDNDRDTDLSKIVGKTIPYAIRAVATLYKMFYDLTHPPTNVSISVDYTDVDGDGWADYPSVYLDLTYAAGADEYTNELEACYKNEVGEWDSWQPVTDRRPWSLSEGNGDDKWVNYRVRNMMGQETTRFCGPFKLREISEPLPFSLSWSASGYNSLPADVTFTISKIWASHASEDDYTDPDLELYWRAQIYDSYGVALTEEMRQPPIPPGYDNSYYHVPIEDEIDISEYPQYVRVHFDNVVPGTQVGLVTRGQDYDDISGDDYLGDIWTGLYPVPTTPGWYTLEEGRYFGTGWGGLGDPNWYYELWINVTAVVWSDPYYGSEGPYPAHVPYGGSMEEARYVMGSGLWADLEWTTEWSAYVDSDIVEYELRADPEGYLRQLWAWTTAEGPDTIVVGFSPVHLLITDSEGRRVGTGWHWSGLYAWDPVLQQQYPYYVLSTVNEIPGATVLQVPTISGEQITLILIGGRELGDYHVAVAPVAGAGPTETYSIGMYTRRRNAASQISPSPPREFAMLVENALVAEMPTFGLGHYSGVSYGVQSTDDAVNLPPRADANGPYMASEGVALTFDAGGSADPNGDPLTYRWDFEDDGVWDTEWSSSPTASHTWNDDWTGTVRVEVSDGTLSGISAATVNITNTRPTAFAGPSRLAAPSEDVQFSGSFTDPGVLDTHTVVWDFGDGTTITDTLTPTHVYSEAGKYTVTLEVYDDDGGVGRDKLLVNTGVDVLIDPLWAFVPPGESLAYNMLVHHLGTTEETYDLVLYGLDPTWYSFSTTAVTLGSDQSESVTVTISPPFIADIVSYSFTVVAVSRTDPAIWDAADADAFVATAHDWGVEEIPPVTTLIVGQPEYVNPISGTIFVTSSTPFMLTAEDNLGGTGVASTFYHILNATHDTGKLKYTAPFSLAGLSDGQYSIVYYSKDNVANKEDAKSETVILDNTPPIITSVANPVSINTPVTLLATVDDSSTGGCRIASAQYSVDGGDWISMNAVDGNFDEVTEDVTATLSPIPTPDVLTITLRGTDALGNGYQLSILLAVYDPAAGFVTGGGWINSPLGAYSADPTLTGKATFGFVSRYQKGANTPTGHTEFQFHAGDLRFQSTSYKWLVVAGSRAQFKGSGTLNKAGNYGFMLTAIDGQINGGGGVDKFRIKIWDKATGIIIYDNQMDIADTDDPTTAIAGGSIVIHKK